MEDADVLLGKSMFMRCHVRSYWRGISEVFLDAFTKGLVGWLMRFNLPLSTVIGYIGEDGDDMRMIGHEIRESPERHLPTLFERTGGTC